MGQLKQIPTHTGGARCQTFPCRKSLRGSFQVEGALTSVFVQVIEKSEFGGDTLLTGPEFASAGWLVGLFSVLRRGPG